MGPDQPREPSLREQIDTYTNWGLFIIHSLALSVEVFLHHSFGRRYMHLQGLGALAAILCWPLFWPNEDAGPMVGFLGLFIGMCLVARIGGLLSRRADTHSRYTGRPYLLWLFPTWDEVQVKQTLEPLLVLAIGFLMLTVSAPLAWYLVTGAIALAAHVATDLALEKRRAQELLDASIEQEQVMESFRRMRGD